MIQLFRCRQDKKHMTQGLEIFAGPFHYAEKSKKVPVLSVLTFLKFYLEQGGGNTCSCFTDIVDLEPNPPSKRTLVPLPVPFVVLKFGILLPP